MPQYNANHSQSVDLHPKEVNKSKRVYFNLEPPIFELLVSASMLPAVFIVVDSQSLPVLKDNRSYGRLKTKNFIVLVFPLRGVSSVLINEYNFLKGSDVSTVMFTTLEVCCTRTC